MRWTTLFVVIILPSAAPAQVSKDGSLSKRLLAKLHENVKLDANTRAAINSVTSRGIREIALDFGLLQRHDELFSKKAKKVAATDQKSTGRCWLFAGLNVLRREVVIKLKVSDFRFSASYLFFWDKLEKANLFLELVIARRDLPLDHERNRFILQEPVPDGGQWNFVVALIDKYGVVPDGVMPESASTSNSRQMFRLLSRKLRGDAARLRSMAKRGASVAKLRREKEEMLAQVYRMLVIHLGHPPVDFTFGYEDKDGKLTKRRRFTPRSFYTELVGVNLKDYVALYHCPTRPYNALYSLETNRDMFNERDLTFVNVELKTFKQIALKSVLAGDPVWFGADVAKMSHYKKGILAATVYDYQAVYGFDIRLSKADRILYRDSTPTHAMLITGVDVVDNKSSKWLVENSWGKDYGKDGYFVMYDDWFDEYVYEIIIHKKHIPPSVLEVLKTKPRVLPEHDPMRAIVQ